MFISHQKEEEYQTRLKDFIISFLFFLLYILRKIQYEWHFRHNKKKTENPDILFSNDCAFWRKYIHNNGKSYYDDIILGDIITKSKEKFDNICCIDVGIPRRTYKDVGNKFDRTSDWEALERFITAKNLFLAFYLTIKRLSSFRPNKLDMDVLHAHHQTKSTFRNFFSILTAKYIIGKLKPKSLITGAEILYMHRALTLIARKNNICVFAVQHGDYGHENPTFNFSGKERLLMKSRIPDYTFAWSKRIKKIMTEESIYSIESVVVTGCTRYDLLANPDSLYSKKVIIKKYSLPENKKRVIWLTQSHSLSEKENLKTLRAFSSCVDNLKNTVLIIKQHPSEPNKYTKIIKKLLSLPNERIILVPQKADTLELLYCCDLMITKNSTAITEAVALSKAVIILNLSDELDEIDWVGEGIALGVYNEQNLASEINNLLKDDSKLSKNREAFLSKHIYKLDGRATERVVYFVEEVLRERKQNKS